MQREKSENQQKPEMEYEENFLFKEIIIIINTFLYGAFTKLNAPYNDLQTENKITIPI